MKYKVGDKVRIVTDKRKATGWNNEGLMDKYLGCVMTIIETRYDHYIMAEDEDDAYGGHWIWNEEMIEGLAVEEEEATIDISESWLMEVLQL